MRRYGNPHSHLADGPTRTTEAIAATMRRQRAMGWQAQMAEQKLKLLWEIENRTLEHEKEIEKCLITLGLETG